MISFFLCTSVFSVAKKAMFNIHKKGLRIPQPLDLSGVPNGIRTRVAALKGLCPRPG